MELQTPPECPSPLGSYRWHTAAAAAGGQRPGAGRAPGSQGWGRLRGWKRSWSQPEGRGPGGGSGPAEVGGRRRSLFRRAFSAPAGQERGRAALRRYLRALAGRRGQGEGSAEERQEATPQGPPGSSPEPSPPRLAPLPPAQVWDVSDFALVDGQLLLVGSAQQAPCRGRDRPGSSEGTDLDPTEAAAAERSWQGTARGTQGEGTAGAQLSSLKGLLWKRLLERKGRGAPRAGPPMGDRVPSCGGSQESLGAVPRVPQLELSGHRVTVRPLHGSLGGERFCFQVITEQGSSTFGCRSLAEREQWMQNLRRCAQPNQDTCERLELALTLRVEEGRELPPGRPLRCHLHLGSLPLARTGAAVPGPGGDLCWGELFHLPSLPPGPALLTLRLCPDGLPARPPLGSVSFALGELAAAGQPLEGWYRLGGGAGAGPGPAVRLRGRCRSLRVLPIVRYKELAEFITFHYRRLCASLEPALGARHREELAAALVRVLQSTGKAKAFLVDLGVAELDRFDGREALIFQEDTLATKAMEEYMKLVGAKYLQDTLGEAVAQLCSSGASCEVDPRRCSGPELLANQRNLRQLCQETFGRIAASCHFPGELAEVFSGWQAECRARGKGGLGQRLVSACLLLRFLCPALLAPSLFGLRQQRPPEAAARSLTLLAKAIQHLASSSSFGEQETFLSFLNDLLEQQRRPLEEFLRRAAEPSGQAAGGDAGVDLALELARLHLLLCHIFSSLDQATQEELEPLPTILKAIKEGTPVPVSVPLSSTTQQSPPEQVRPPRALLQLSRSQSLSSLRPRGREDDAAPPPPPEAPPPPPEAPPPEGAGPRSRRSLQRARSVPAQPQGSGGRRQELLWTATQDGPGGQGPGRLLASLPPKPAVPWQRPRGEAEGAQEGSDPGAPLEKAVPPLGALRQELERCQGRLRLLEASLGQAEQRLCQQRQEAEARAHSLAARLAAAEGSRRKDLERLRSSEEKAQELECRLAALEQALGWGQCQGPGPGLAARGWAQSGAQAQASSL